MATKLQPSIQASLNLVDSILECLKFSGEDVSGVKDALVNLLQNSDISQVGTLISKVNDVNKLFKCVLQVAKNDPKAKDLLWKINLIVVPELESIEFIPTAKSIILEMETDYGAEQVDKITAKLQYLQKDIGPILQDLNKQYKTISANMKIKDNKPSTLQKIKLTAAMATILPKYAPQILKAINTLSQ